MLSDGREYRPYRRARGTRQLPSYGLRIAISFPPTTFRTIEAMAQSEGVSFAAKVRQLVDHGLNGKHETPF